MSKTRLVVKVGSNVLISAQGELRENVLNSLVSQISSLWANYEIALVTSGAVRFGKTERLKNFVLRDYRNLKYEKEILREQLFASVGQPKLMNKYLAAFSTYAPDIDCSQILATTNDFSDRSRYISLKTTADNLLAAGAFPIFNANDVVSPEIKGEHISDNDRLAAMISVMVNAKKLIILTDVEGFYDGDPSDPQSKLIHVISDPETWFSKIDDSNVSKGGMTSKLEVASLVTQLGLDMHMACGMKENILLDIVEGKVAGTYFPARSTKKVSALRQWLATAPSKGEIVVSTLLADALKNKRPTSVLCSGIEKVNGEFTVGDIVTIVDDNNRRLGKGQVKFSSESLAVKILDREKAKDIIAVHYDYFIFV